MARPHRFEFTPDLIEFLEPHEIFVFGSNTEGRHGKGAALTALRDFGAIYGQAAGRQGQSYAIVTKELRYRTHPKVTLGQVREGVRTFMVYAKAHPELTFYVTKLGCSLAGFAVEDIARLFQSEHNGAGNIVLPREFTQPLYQRTWLPL